MDETHGDRRIAFLVDNDFAFGMVRMFTAIGDDLKADMQVFRVEVDAKAWIGLAADFKLP